MKSQDITLQPAWLIRIWKKQIRLYQLNDFNKLIVFNAECYATFGAEKDINSISLAELTASNNMFCSQKKTREGWRGIVR